MTHNILILSNKNQLVAICRTYGVQRLELFGSAARQEPGVVPRDLDFLVTFTTHDVAGAFDRYFGLKEELETLFQCPIDIVESHAIRNPYFRQAVDREKVCVYAQ